MKLSVLIPVHNEEDCIERVALTVAEKLDHAAILYELLIINDSSTDGTEQILTEVARQNAAIRYRNNPPPHGFGLAVRCGLEHFSGDAVAIYMGDGSDSPDDLIRFYRKLQEGFDCVFGTRWGSGGRVSGYPPLKRVMNRCANNFIRGIMQIGYNDITNAFKLYRREVIQGIQPLLSKHYNLTVELPLKAIIRGYSYAIVPNSWTNRKAGESKLRIKEMGSRYLFIVLYCLLEKWLSQGDYYRT
ncbi:glycosyltransferase [candidate division KSB3 bacterium]|uniref:Glycosyltransferase n=1 Tax=candidate division KSB3 bacterium TaxID=2044937 RepID=A0A9D5JYK1_9BACT|nr:glycosyltransferase [candidate division KSB3 bacterium]MBD3326754.1 glycosyltransferase [candidate division KSB3 bacterium]